MADVKTCTKCGETKSESDFYWAKKTKRWRSSQCKSCTQAYEKAKYAANPEPNKTRNSKWYHAGGNHVRRVRAYGTDGVAMMAAQGAKCAICGVAFSNPGDPEANKLVAHLDHSHRTGEPRGWLCRKCNLLLGLADDNATLLLKAVEYLIGIN